MKGINKYLAIGIATFVLADAVDRARNKHYAALRGQP